MSAVSNPATVPDSSQAHERHHETRLRAVPVQRRAVSTPVFAVFILVVLIVNMVFLVMITTTIQGKSAELVTLQAEESQLRYQRAAMSAQVQDLRSSQNLAARAWELGMRPNPNPAFIEMPSGMIVGEAIPVIGDELTGMTPVTTGD